MAMALALALWVAQAVQQHAQEGVQRWQKDAQMAGAGAPAEGELALTRLWCQRDGDFMAQWAFASVAGPCRADARGLLADAWRWVRVPPAWPVQRQWPHVQRWQQEVMARSQQWRMRLLAADAALMGAAMANDSAAEADLPAGASAMAEVAAVRLEPQLAGEVWQLQAQATKRLAQWDRWVAERVQPLVQAPASEVQPELLWGVAESLSGVGGDVGAKMVSLRLKAHDHAARAGYLLRILAHLPLLLVGHAVFTVLAARWMRAAIAPWQQLNGLLGLGLLFWCGLLAVGVAPSPATYPGLLAGLGVWVLLSWVQVHFFPHKRPAAVASRLVLASWIPGWWLFTAIGWLLLLDQSLHFHERLRFLALEQWWAWCLSALLLPLSAWAAPWLWGMALRLGRAAWARWPRGWSGLRWLAGVLWVAVLGLAHRQHLPQQVTGELLKAMALLGLCGWCIWKMPITAQLWHAGHARQAWRGLVDVLLLMAWVAAAAFLTADKGPLLVLALLVTVLLATVLGWTAGMGLLVLGFATIFWLGVDLDVVGERLQAWRDPFTANRDDMARLVWFQTEAARGAWGFGVGQVPWCGTSRLDVCHGLPLQLQSDYTFTALMGWWGPRGAWLCLLAFTAYAYRALVHCARCSPALLTPLALLDSRVLARAWALHGLFLFAVLILMQTWITVAGNLGWLPLTGVTWPLIGYGKTSLWISTVFVGAWGLRRSHA